ncbi:IclR family transcriptional regulator [Streptomyces melanogenes]|uniref:IclR family transcriptional regulator n=1 Tax=Streptomyces melanogenes TaxID=67326 RepID=UPI00167DC434|nr:IclR family transcriptional regulator [Streptomyces melanogenes]GGP57607.1 IclR family transcriptional regulator [Streptomyces melanogenes]
MTEATTVRTPTGAQAVQRALEVLHSFHDNGPDLSASDLSRRLGLPVSTAHRLARTLVGAGFLEQDVRTARYRLGPAMTELGRLSYHQRGLHLAAPELADLAARTGAAADLALRSGPHVVSVAGGPVPPLAGLRRPLRSTAPGRVLLAWPRPDEPAALDEELADVRADGFAREESETAPTGAYDTGYGTRTLAVPVLDRSGHARFALSLRAAPAVMTDERAAWFLAQARACAQALEILLLPPAERRPPAA